MFNIHFTIEHWKWNPDFELYVSNKGRFRNRDKKEVPIQIGSDGYCWIYCGGTAHRHLLAHRVVMLTWRPTPNAEHLTVDHRDHNKRNNAVDNLEWVTYTENQRRAIADNITVDIKADPALVEKVNVSVIAATNPASLTKYDYQLRLRGSVMMTIEDFSTLFFPYYGKSQKNPITQAVCQNVAEFAETVIFKTQSNHGKVCGMEYEKIFVSKDAAIDA